jgi:signal transduction histidine kinase
MEINRTHRWLYFLTTTWMILVILLGGWWLYLVFKFASVLETLKAPGIESMSSIVNMIRWEGLTFIVLMILLAVSLFLIYMRDIKKTRSIGAFFASLTHELKTPLASMRLQAEVLKDLIQDEAHSHEQLSDLAKRLISDSQKFESELDKSLQLSRIEQGAPLHLEVKLLVPTLKRIIQNYPDLTIEIKPHDLSGISICMDDTAFKTVFKNLIENTIRHQPNSKKVEIQIKPHPDQIEIIYDDFGSPFQGHKAHLGELFYRFQSEKGSGIGLYLIKKMMIGMEGHLTIADTSHLIFHLFFKRGVERE